MEDIVEYIDRKNLEGIIVFLDFEKAFDSIEWNFMFACLEKFNFGPNFTKWIKAIYNKPIALIKNNGWLSQKVEIFRGIKQGCPLSALLFIIATEILSINIKTSRKYKGLGIHEKEIKIIQYADDTILFFERDADVENAINIIKKFTSVAGLKLNLNKTEGLRLGKSKHIASKLQIIRWRDHIKCLGIYVGTNKSECMKLNWSNKVEDMQRLLDSWRTRDLTLFGKTLIIKCLAVSKIVFVATNTCLPADMCKIINKIIYGFIWKKKDRIQRNVLIGPIEKGGLNFPDIESFFSTLKARWVDRILCNTGTWCYLSKLYMEKDNVLLKTNITDAKHIPSCITLPPFYQEVLLCYNKLKNIGPLPNTYIQLSNEVIWGNNLLQVYNSSENNMKCLFHRSWIESGIIYVGDIPLKKGMIDIAKLMRRLNSKLNMLVEAKMVQEALRPFKNLLKDTTVDTNLGRDLERDIVYTLPSNRKCYEHLIQNRYKISKFKVLETILGRPLAMLEIESMCQNKIVKITEQKLREFNYKVIHNILPCGALLSKWCKDRPKDCDICSLKEDVHHLLWECQLAQKLWTVVGNALDTVICKQDLFIGRSHADDFNFVISFMAFELYKYRLSSWDKKSIRTIETLLPIIKNKIKYKQNIYKLVENQELVKHTGKLRDILQFMSCILLVI